MRSSTEMATEPSVPEAEVNESERSAALAIADVVLAVVFVAMVQVNHELRLNATLRSWRAEP